MLQHTALKRQWMHRVTLFPCVVFRTVDIAEITYWYLHRLLTEVTGRLEGFRPRGEPVGGDGSESTHTHERVGGETAHVLPDVIQLGNAQLSQDFLSLHGCCALTLQERREGRGSFNAGLVSIQFQVKVVLRMSLVISQETATSSTSWWLTKSPLCKTVVGSPVSPQSPKTCTLGPLTWAGVCGLYFPVGVSYGCGDTAGCSILSFYQWVSCFRSLYIRLHIVIPLRVTVVYYHLHPHNTESTLCCGGTDRDQGMICNIFAVITQ